MGGGGCWQASMEKNRVVNTAEGEKNEMIPLMRVFPVAQHNTVERRQKRNYTVDSFLYGLHGVGISPIEFLGWTRTPIGSPLFFTFPAVPG